MKNKIIEHTIDRVMEHSWRLQEFLNELQKNSGIIFSITTRYKGFFKKKIITEIEYYEPKPASEEQLKRLERIFPKVKKSLWEFFGDNKNE